MIEYDGYAVGATSDMTLRYEEGDNSVEFGFSPGGSESSPVVIWKEPMRCSSEFGSDKVECALSRLVDHLKSIGYRVHIEDQNAT